MDIKRNDTTDAPLTVRGYADAIQRIGSGQFTSRFREEGREFFASFYGAPFFALSQLAPEAIDDAEIQALLIAADSAMGSDAGRWLSLYARVHRATGKFNLSVCVSSKPRSFKPPKPLLFQPMQSVVVKDWGKYLDALGSPPNVLLFYPRTLDELKQAAHQFPRNVPGGKLLVSCQSRVESLIARRVLELHGYEVGDLVNFGRLDDEPQHWAAGAWWFSTQVPRQSELLPADPAIIDGLSVAQQQFEILFLAADTQLAREQVAALIATRTTETVDGHSIQALRLSGVSGIDLATGKRFSTAHSDPESAFVWEDFTLPSDLLAKTPRADAAPSEDDDRLALMVWLGEALAECSRREQHEPTLDEDAGQGDADVTAPMAAALAPKPSTSPTADSAPSPLATSATESPVRAPPPPQGPARPRLSRSAGTVNVLALAARLGTPDQNASGVFNNARNRLLAWLKNKGFGELDPSRNQHCEQPDGELTIETDGSTIWSLRFDDRSSMESGAIWRVEATLLGQPSPALSLRLFQVRSSEDAPPPVASGVPQVVASIAKDLGLQDAGVPLQNTALRFKGDAEAHRLGDLLLNPHRAQPVIVIAGTIDASADRLAKRLAGVAHVAVIDSAAVNHLIRRFGRDLSVYGSAVRLYRPGFETGADQYRHRVWPRKGPQLSKWLANDLFEEACAISVDSDDLEERAPSFQAVRSHLAAARLASSEQRLATLRAQAESIASSKDEQISQLQEIRGELESALEEYKRKAADLDGSHKELLAELQAIRLERDSALEEARQLRYQISNRWVDEVTTDQDDSDDSYYPDTWDELEEWVDIFGEGKLVLHSKAAKAARASPFKDVSMAYKAMEYLVRYYIPMRTRSEDDTDAYARSLHRLAELGLEESDVGTADEIRRYKKEYERIYEGRTVTLDRHLKRGVGFGGEYQFRLYFYYDQEQGKVLVGHLPTHLTNRLTHNG